MNQPHPTQITISVKDAASLSTLSEWEVREEVNKGTFPAMRHGRRILIDYDGFRAWLKSLTPVSEAAS